MEHRGQTASKTAWMFKDNISSWTWKGHEGEKASVDVYSSGDEVELFLVNLLVGSQLEKNPITQQHMKLHMSQGL